ncbi:MAG: P-II family nitrogen regulator [Gemmatimonadota bacterium]
MKLIKAFLRPEMLDAVVDAVEKLPGAPGLTVSTVRGFGHRIEGGPAQMTERVKLEIVVTDEDVEGVLALIADRARTGRTGDGKIFVTEVAEAVRVRTGERGDAAVRPATARPSEC